MPLIKIENAALAGIDAFPLSFKVQEGLSSNPVYHLEFQSPEPDVDLAGLLGEGVTLHIEQPDGGSRPFFAYAVAGFDEGQREDQFVYKLELSTWFWFLMQNRNCRIFQDVTIIDIIEQVFSRYNFADYHLDIEGSYPQREYCVQFAETDFAFVSRLLEDEGVWYYFVHNSGKHTLVITDRQHFSPLAGDYAQLSFLPDSEEMRAIREGIQRIQRSHRVHPSEVVLRDFDYLNPRSSLQTQVAESRQHVQGVPLEWYDYAAGYTDTQRGEAIARLRLEAMQSDGQQLSGESNAVGLMPGASFTLEQHPDSRRNRAFKLLRCDYTFLQDGPDSASQGRNVACRFIALNDDTTYRPPRTTPRPQVAGIQSATVVGAVESEVHTDKFARIRVHFHWDRYKSTEEDSSCWIRVVQAWAGKGWGVIAMPRVGQEVLITYVDGDLDRPMVTGIVYNGDNPPPYRLPEHINYSGIVSRSLRFGNPQHASQLTFDDKRGSERVMLHAERDLQNTVERNIAVSIGQDKYEEVERTTTEKTQNRISYADVSFSITGFDVALKGIDISFTGINASFIGTNTSVIGVNTSLTGIGTSFTGVNTAFIGTNTSFTGANTAHIGINNLMVGSSNAFTGIANNLIGSNHSFIGCNTTAIGKNIGMTGSSLTLVGSNINFTGSHLGTTGSSVTFIGSSISAIGSSISTTGKSISFTGDSISTTGKSIAATGLRIAATGNSISVTGCDISTTGSAISVKGLSISCTALDLSQVGLDLKTLGMQIKN